MNIANEIINQRLNAAFPEVEQANDSPRSARYLECRYSLLQKIILLDARLFSRERKYHIAQVIHEFMLDGKHGQEIINLLWNWNTEPILTEKELKAPCEGILTPSEIADLCKFYFEAIGRNLMPLKGLCRNKIVNTLRENGDLINRMSKLPLPPRVQSYLSHAI